MEDTTTKILNIKRMKAVRKSQLIKLKNKMLRLLDEDLPSRKELRVHQQHLENLHENVMELINMLMDYSEAARDTTGFVKLNEEMERLVEDYGELQARA